MNKPQQRWLYPLLVLVLVVLFFTGLVYGAVRIPLKDVIQILLGSYE